MRASAAVSLLFASSMTVFGIFSTHRNTAQPVGIEPVWVNGEQGVYSPSTGDFVPSTSPMYAETCDEIRDSRAGNDPTTGPYSGSSGSSYYHHYYGPSYYGSTDHRSTGSSSSSSSSRSFGSARGGVGSTGHSFGGGHS